MTRVQDERPGRAENARLSALDMEIRRAERRLERIRRKQREFEEWERSRRPIRIGFLIVIPIVLLIEGGHLYRTLDRTQGHERAPWLLAGALLVVAVLSWWYYRQAQSQRKRVFGGRRRAARLAEELEARLLKLRREAEQGKGGSQDESPLV